MLQIFRSGGGGERTSSSGSSGDWREGSMAADYPPSGGVGEEALHDGLFGSQSPMIVVVEEGEWYNEKEEAREDK